MEKRVVQPPVEQEVNEEFSFHVEMRVRELVEEGWDEEEARAEAIRRFGDIERVKAACRNLGRSRNVSMGRRLWWDEIRQDLGYGIRQLRRAPSFALITILTLGIAIGANTAVFSVVNGVLVQPLPYPDSEDLVALWTRYLPPSGFDIDKFSMSGPEILDVKEETRSMSSVGIFRTNTEALTGEAMDAERLRSGYYSHSVLPTLDVPAHLGRWFTPEEDVPETTDVTILSYDLWQRRFGGDRGILGKGILLDGMPVEVVGVMPEGFAFPEGTELWLPLRLDRTTQGGRGGHSYSAIGRVAPGMTPADVEAELDVFRQRWAGMYEHNEAHYMWSQSYRDEVVADAPEKLALLMSAVALVLLVACANIANLLLARGERRNTEVAVRSALGAGRGRITRQLATESLVLASVAAVVGLGLAWVGTKALIAIDPTSLPRLAEVRLDGTVLGFTAAITLVTALLFGVAPAYLAGARSSAAVASSATRTVGGRSASSLRRLLVAGEVAVSLVVVILAGLVVRSFAALTSTDVRMDPENLVVFEATLPVAAYPDWPQVPAEWERLLDGLRAVPGVTSATAATTLPFEGKSQWDFQIAGRPPRQEGEVARNAGISHVSTDYFRTLGVPILEGRGLTPQDGREDPLVAVVSASMASRFWPGESVIGKRFGYQMDDGVPWMTIVGVAPDPITNNVAEERYPHLWVPESQAGISTYGIPRTMSVAVRTAAEPESLMPSIRLAMAEFDADLPLYRLRTMEELISSSLAGPRVMTNLLGSFAVIALILAAVGIYGVISYSVAGRTREIGVRVALGAERSEITKMILGEGARPVVGGIALGLLGAWYATRLVDAMLFGVGPTDPVTFATLPLALLLVGVVASLLPALRATSIAPTEALRE